MGFFGPRRWSRLGDWGWDGMGWFLLGKFFFLGGGEGGVGVWGIEGNAVPPFSFHIVVSLVRGLMGGVSRF